MDQIGTTALADAVAELQTELNRSDRTAAEESRVGSAEDIQVLRLLLGTGPLRVGELARRRSASAATTSARLDRLEKRGFIARERVPDDRRAVWARLTEEGRSVAEASRAARHRALASLSPSFPIDAVRALTDALSAPTSAALQSR